MYGSLPTKRFSEPDGVENVETRITLLEIVCQGFSFISLFHLCGCVTGFLR